MSRFQFTLVHLHVAALISCVLSAAIHLFGAGLVMLVTVWLAGFGVLTLLWAMVYVLAPQATKYGTVCGFFGVMLLSLLSLHTLQSHEEARRTRCIHHLRILGEERTLQRDFQRVEPRADLGLAGKSVVFNLIPGAPPVAQSSATGQP
jgi:hypothetical protein